MLDISTMLLRLSKSPALHCATLSFSTSSTPWSDVISHVRLLNIQWCQHTFTDQAKGCWIPLVINPLLRHGINVSLHVFLFTQATSVTTLSGQILPCASWPRLEYQTAMLILQKMILLIKMKGRYLVLGILVPGSVTSAQLNLENKTKQFQAPLNWNLFFCPPPKLIELPSNMQQEVYWFSVFAKIFEMGVTGPIENPKQGDFWYTIGLNDN